MLTVNKFTCHSAVDHAAEELKKYLRMMMPEGGDIKIAYASEAKGGFRLGTMEDLGIAASSGICPELDDEIYIDTDGTGGVIAGANPRAVLIAVYEYLRENGCRWLFPGVDGEYIPMQDIRPVKIRKRPAMRNRGACIEGAIEQKMLLDFIDFMPKVGLNCFMNQFRTPSTFYKRHYCSTFNDEGAKESNEPVGDGQILSWVRAGECEMAKRGILLHSYGHGFSNDPFGIDSAHAWDKLDNSDIPAEAREFLAEINGERGLYRGQPANTQLCLSNERGRKKVAKYAADYLEGHSNIDYLHIWLGDLSNNHCECAECSKKTVSDWYMILMNDVDAELTARGLSNRIVFIVYADTVWPPATERLVNPDRFTMMMAPISRNYSLTEDEPGKTPEKRPFVRNKLTFPQSLSEYMLYMNDWKNTFGGSSFSFEYHFWQCHAYDISGINVAKRIYEDIAAYRKWGIDGVMECGTQRPFFPNGLAFYTHARASFDGELSYGDIEKDYFTHAYGKGAEEFRAALAALEEAVPQTELNLKHAMLREEGYCTKRLAEGAKRLGGLADSLSALVKKYYDSDVRVETKSVRLLEAYADYLRLLQPYLSALATHRTEDCDGAIENIKRWVEENAAGLIPYFEYRERVNTLIRWKNLVPRVTVENYAEGG